ncbi:sulfotransferase domain-containing protein [Actinoplanes sp. NPDC051859]|uniref:sulfotransferase domain-containing protein n=1 Tax=Actinoplanes sp. NPDC051859 TaxID=3363909 RepID=UPI0037ABA435
MFNRTVMYAKQHTPNAMRVVVRRTMLEAHNTRLRLTVPVVARSEYVNIYHCAVRKTASQWIKALFSDPIVYRHSGLPTYDPRFYNWRHPQVCPPDRVALSLFFSRKRFDAIPKPERHRAFFVLRDPRDMVVSSYFSTRKSHAPMGDIPKVRRALEELPVKDGMLYLINHLAQKGTFKALRSWANAGESGNVRLFRYEDLTGPGQTEQVDQLMRHCGIVIPPAELSTLLHRYSFSEMNHRESAGTVSHYRKGSPGDWRNHFDDDIQEAFARASGNLTDLLGYRSESTSVRV